MGGLLLWRSTEDAERWRHFISISHVRHRLSQVFVNGSISASNRTFVCLFMGSAKAERPPIH